MSNTFSYLVDKIRDTSFSDGPYRHLEIKQFLRPEHFESIVRDPQIQLEGVPTTEVLLDKLEENGYKIIPFPGCITSKVDYLKWFKSGKGKPVHANIEGFGIVFRLTRYDNKLLDELTEFFESDLFKAAVCEKFGISKGTTIDTGIQKYLHGYEISPHPDIRRKALTWMLNLNPGKNAEQADYHTHYMKLKNEYNYVKQFWKDNKDYDRDWLPWNWCETVKRQSENNSIVFFVPSDETLHAVKANYDHLQTQRTQFYGNLWYEAVKLKKLDFRALDVAMSQQQIEIGKTQQDRVLKKLKAGPVGSIYRATKQMLRRSEKVETIRKI